MPWREGPRKLEGASPAGDPPDHHHPGSGVAPELRYELGRLPWLALLYLRSRFLRPRLAMLSNLRHCSDAGRTAPVRSSTSLSRDAARGVNSPGAAVSTGLVVRYTGSWQKLDGPAASMRQWPKRVG